MHISVNILKTTELYRLCRYINYISTKLLKQANRKPSRQERADYSKGNYILQITYFMARHICTDTKPRNSRRLDRKTTGRGRKEGLWKLLSPHYETIRHLNYTHSF